MAFAFSPSPSSFFKSHDPSVSVDKIELPTNLRTSVRLPLARSFFPISLSVRNPNRNAASVIVSVGGHDNFPPGNNGGNGSGGGGGDNGGRDDGGNEEDELGPVLNYDEVMKEVESRGTTLPPDMLEAAKSVGIRRLHLLRYLDLQVQFPLFVQLNLRFLIIIKSLLLGFDLKGAVWPVGELMRSCPLFRDRMLADPSFLFKVGTEVSLLVILEFSMLNFNFQFAI